MSEYDIVEGDYTFIEGKFVIVESRFNEIFVDRLREGALDALRRHHVPPESITIVRVPGAFELPLGAAKAAEVIKPAAIIALGVVIRGATPHFDYVCGECSSGLSRVMLETKIPIGFGVLTVDTLQQAMERAGSKAGNKGADAALAVLEMVSLMDQLS